MSDPKHHHIVPAFYLAGFSDTGKRKGFVSVFNLIRKARFRGRPDAVGGINHFYAINPEAGDPVLIEKWMNQWIEGPASNAIEQARTTLKISKGRQIGEILTLAAMMHVRSEATRLICNHLSRKRILRLLIAGEVSQTQWDTYISDRRWISTTPEDIPIKVEEATRLARSGSFVPDAMPTATVGQIPELTVRLLDVLEKRAWSLLVADEEAGHFITSNSPLTSGEGWSTHLGPEGLGNPDATVVFPIGVKLAIISWQREPWHRYTATRRLVGLINARTLNRSWGEIYWDGSDFPLLDASGALSSFEPYYLHFSDDKTQYELGFLRQEE